MVRAMFGVSPMAPIWKKAARQKPKVTDTARKINKLKWKWAGHVCRTADEADFFWGGKHGMTNVV